MEDGRPRCLCLRAVGGKGGVGQCKRAASVDSAEDKQLCTTHLGMFNNPTKTVKLVTLDYDTEMESDAPERIGESDNEELGGIVSGDEQGKAKSSVGEEEKSAGKPKRSKRKAKDSSENDSSVLQQVLKQLEVLAVRQKVIEDRFHERVDSSASDNDSFLASKASSVRSSNSKRGGRKGLTVLSQEQEFAEASHAVDAAEKRLEQLLQRQSCSKELKLSATAKRTLKKKISAAIASLSEAKSNPVLRLENVSDCTESGFESSGSEADSELPGRRYKDNLKGELDYLDGGGGGFKTREKKVNAARKKEPPSGVQDHSDPLQSLEAANSLVVSLAGKGIPLTRFQLVEVLRASVEVPWVRPADTFQTVDDDSNELLFNTDSSGQLSAKKKKKRLKRYPSALAWATAWTHLMPRVVRQASFERQELVREALLTHQALVLQLHQSNGWESVSLYVVACAVVWQLGGVLVLQELPCLWGLVESGYLGTVEVLIDPFDNVARFSASDRAAHTGGGRRPPYKKSVTCSGCKMHGWSQMWCPVCRPELPGTLAALHEAAAARKKV